MDGERAALATGRDVKNGKKPKSEREPPRRNARPDPETKETVVLTPEEFRDLAASCDTFAAQARALAKLYEEAAEACFEQARRIDARLEAMAVAR